VKASSGMEVCWMAMDAYIVLLGTTLTTNQFLKIDTKNGTVTILDVELPEKECSWYVDVRRT
jgi:hypothetical protein